MKENHRETGLQKTEKQIVNCLWRNKTEEKYLCILYLFLSNETNVCLSNISIKIEMD